MYKQVYANATKYETTFLPSVAVSVEEASRAIEAVYNDHPELFWVDTTYSYKYNSENKCVQIILSFNNTFNNIEEARTAFVKNANMIISNAQNLKSNYEKEKYVHDTIIALASYDVDESNNQSAYSALVTGKTVCAGYSRAFQYIMTNLGIPTYYIFGSAEGEHAWNIVKLDGEFYNVDLTWDDSEKLTYAFFNVPDVDFEKSHTRAKESTLLPRAEGQKYSGLEGKYTYKDKIDESKNDPIYWWQDESAEIP